MRTDDTDLTSGLSGLFRDSRGSQAADNNFSPRKVKDSVEPFGARICLICSFNGFVYDLLARVQKALLISARRRFDFVDLRCLVLHGFSTSFSGEVFPYY